MAADDFFGQPSFGDIEEEKKVVLTSCFILARWEPRLSSGSDTPGFVTTLENQPEPVTPSFWWKVTPLWNRGLDCIALCVVMALHWEAMWPSGGRFACLCLVLICRLKLIPVLLSIILGEAQSRRSMRGNPFASIFNGLWCLEIFLVWIEVLGGFSFLWDATVDEFINSKWSSSPEQQQTPHNPYEIGAGRYGPDDRWLIWSVGASFS